VLEVLFRSAITGAKKVKTALSLSTANASAVEMAIAKMSQEGFDFSGKNCLVIGNGEMGKRTADALTKMGAKVTVTVRQYRSGIVEIPDNCQRINYGDRFNVLPMCDIIVSATSSPNVTIKYDDLKNYTIDEDKIFIDLAVPRDIDPEVASLPHVKLYDIDDFSVSQTDELKMQLQEAEQMLTEQKNKFMNWYECRDLIPATGRIADYIAEEVDLRVGAVVKDLGLDKGQNEELTSAIDSAAGKVMKKLLFAVRDTAGVDVFRQCIEAMESTYSNENA
jgi:glutamyl-tRNA reductase